TRLYDADRDETRSMRSKEEAMDYRYFPDPDLLPLMIAPAWIARVKAAMPPLPQVMSEQFQRDYGLSAYDAGLLVASKATATYFETAVQALGGESNAAKLTANWMNGELAAALNRADMSIDACPIAPAGLASLIRHILNGALSHKLGKQVFEALWAGEGADAGAIMAARGLRQLSDVAAIEQVVDAVLAANQKSVDEFKAGKEKALQALVGQVMKATQGRANPAQVNEALRRRLSDYT
ncbi:MAG: Asp-tRNA(Asn)/Glu-tRNA(Gln) amidotransferase GatCAB subunit B, partial [Betaproteobacteria bacterium]|nr:Asp-tRNA(Asn)/Glu-tRNA(Gln) amidotransferase GatCAB subunit B [Betaproteobacteria bacterium]